MVLVEACIETLGQALAAEAGGAGRIELCANLAEQGTTPPDALLSACLSQVKLPVFSIIRPRAGSFVYADDELETMLRQVRQARDLGAHGIVSGALDTAGRIDAAAVSALVRAAHPLPFTFHRAFDALDDQAAGLDTLLSLGVDRVLTSGGAATALRGADAIARLVRQAGGRLVVMAGGGVRAHNVREILGRTGVHEVHGRLGSAHSVRAVVAAASDDARVPHAQ